jgi:perosamine synthetase
MRNIFRKVISASLSPNTERDDVFIAFTLLFRPWEWIRGHATHRVEEWFSKNYPNNYALSFNSGRSALLGILKAFEIGKNDEVLVQSFTCVAVPNSVLWVGAKPVYVDIDNSLNIDLVDAEKKVSSKTRVIIVQHTLGLPADMKAITAFAKIHHLLVVEDCAHALGVGGLSGDAAFFSFGRDKVISSVFGGVAIIQKRYATEIVNLKEFHKRLLAPRLFWIFQQLFHPVLFAVVLPLYRIGIGKLILFIFQKTKLLSFPVYPEEKYGKKPEDFPATFPNALAVLLFNQLKKIERFNKNRQNQASYYIKELAKNTVVTQLLYPKDSIFLRFPVLVPKPEVIIKKAKQNGILLGNWYHNVIDPVGVDFKKVNYQVGSCPKAEYIAKHILNLPTRISSGDAREVVRQII